MDERRGTVETPFLVPIIAMVNIGMGLVLVIRSGYFLSSHTSDSTVRALAAVGLVELIVGAGLAAQTRWAWWATLVLIPLNLAGAIALWIMASDGVLLIPVLIYAVCATLLFVPLPRLGPERDQIWAWSATRWAKDPAQGRTEPTEATREERPLAA